MQHVFHKRWMGLGLGALGWLLMLGQGALAESIADRRLRFKVELPDGFVASPLAELMSLEKDYVFESTSEPKMVLSFQGLYRPMPEPREGQRCRPSCPDFQVESIGWKSLTLDLIKRVDDRKEKHLTVYTMLVPVDTQAIHVRLASHDASDEQMKSVLQSTLDHFQANSNWTMTGSSPGREDSQNGAGLVGYVLATLFLGGLIWRATRSKGPLMMTGAGLLVLVSGFGWEALSASALSSPWPTVLKFAGGLAMLASVYDWYHVWSRSRSAQLFLAETH